MLDSNRVVGIGADEPKLSFGDVQKLTGLDKSELQNFGKYVEPAERALGTGNRSRYSARNVFSFVLMEKLARLRVPASVAAEWATTAFIGDPVAYAWLVSGGSKGHMPHATKYMYEFGDDPRWIAYDEKFLGKGCISHNDDFAVHVADLVNRGKVFAVVPTGPIFKQVLLVTGMQEPEIPQRSVDTGRARRQARRQQVTE